MIRNKVETDFREWLGLTCNSLMLFQNIITEESIKDYWYNNIFKKYYETARTYRPKIMYDADIARKYKEELEATAREQSKKTLKRSIVDKLSLGKPVKVMYLNEVWEAIAYNFVDDLVQISKGFSVIWVDPRDISIVTWEPCHGDIVFHHHLDTDDFFVAVVVKDQIMSQDYTIELDYALEHNMIKPYNVKYLYSKWDEINY